MRLASCARFASSQKTVDAPVLRARVRFATPIAGYENSTDRSEQPTESVGEYISNVLYPFLRQESGMDIGNLFSNGFAAKVKPGFRVYYDSPETNVLDLHAVLLHDLSYAGLSVSFILVCSASSVLSCARAIGGMLTILAGAAFGLCVVIPIMPS